MSWTVLEDPYVLRLWDKTLRMQLGLERWTPLLPLRVIEGNWERVELVRLDICRLKYVSLQLATVYMQVR